MFHEQGRTISASNRPRRVAPRRPDGPGLVQYQPFVELSSWRRLGAEAIERNFHDGGTRRRHSRDDTVLRLACVEAVEWDSGTVAVNISSSQLRGGMLLAQIGAALEHSGLAAERLELEIGETILTEIDLDTMLTLSLVRDLGVGVVLDEFGTGLASLRMLKRLPLTGLKLDVSLVREVPGNPEDAAIARTVIAAAHALGLNVLAAGIESESQLAALAGYGCDAGQGPLFADAPREAPRPGHGLAGTATGRR